MDVYFSFKGKTNDEMGVLIAEYANYQHPQKRINKIEVEGRDGVLYEDLNSYENYSLTFSCAVDNVNNSVDKNEILKWLSGEGDLILSIEPTKVYKAKIINAIPLSSVIWLFNDFTVTFEVEPFKNNCNSVSDIVEITKPVKLYNKGDVKSLPIIDIYGTGEITVTINDVDYTVQNVQGYVTINSEIQETYKDKTNKNNNALFLEYPILNVGENSISFTGNVEKIVINPNWRWL